MTNDSFSSLFPCLATKPWKYVNLNEENKKYKDADMKDIRNQIELLDVISENGKYYTYGGFGEDRTELWDGFEPEALKMYHLGIDFNNLNINEKVASLSDGVVVCLKQFEDTFNGWGLRIIIKDTKTNIYYLYGHLNKSSFHLSDVVKKGDIIGEIGDYIENGGWFRHLHLQIMEEKYVKKFDDLLDIDGYDFIYDQSYFAEMGILNPIEFI